jgi:hypothetical protein
MRGAVAAVKELAGAQDCRAGRYRLLLSQISEE